MKFNTAPPSVLHIDINSCFATVEQQANPFLRGKPLVVAAYESANGCVLAASIEAKQFGVKTGMRVRDAKQLCPRVLVMSTDPWKYRNIHLLFRKLLGRYSPHVSPKSIDEFVVHLDQVLHIYDNDPLLVARKIKNEIEATIGDWIQVSIGIGPNRYLAKTAAGLIKPNGLEVLDTTTYEEVYRHLPLTKLTGIKDANAARLRSVGIRTVWDFYEAPLWKLKAAFHSVTSYYWYMRLRGYEIDDVEYARRSYGNSYSLPRPLETRESVSPIISKLVTKTSGRLRKAGLIAQGVHLALQYKEGGYWHQGHKCAKHLFSTQDIYEEVMRLYDGAPHAPLRHIAISVFELHKENDLQLDMFTNTLEKVHLMKAVDSIHKRWGDYVVYPARMIDTERFIPDRIAFGGVKELEEISI